MKINMPTPRQEPLASSKSPNEDLKDIHMLCTFKIKIESQNMEMGVPKISDPIQIKIKMPKPFRNLQPSLKPKVRT